MYIINQYASSPEVGGGSRHFYIAKELIKHGHEVFLVTANFTHLMHNPVDLKKNTFIKKINNINYIYLKTFKYKESNDFIRIINWVIFSWRVSRLFKLITNKPEIIIVSTPSPFSFLGAFSLVKKFKSKFIYDIRDIWPLSIVELGGISPKNPIIIIMQWIEKRAYNNASLITSTIPYAYEYLKTFGVGKDKFSCLPNGFDKDELLKKEKIKTSISSKIPKKKFIVGYIGSLGLANALHVLINAAKLLNDNKSIAFVVIGKGSELSNLKAQVKFLNLINFYFIDQIPKKQIQPTLNLFDVCYLGWLNKTVYKFGVSPQKIPEYLFSGKPIIHSYSGKGCPINEANAGISVQAEDPIAIKNAILKLKKMDNFEREKLGKNGKNYCNKNYDYRVIARKLEKLF